MMVIHWGISKSGPLWTDKLLARCQENYCEKVGEPCEQDDCKVTSVSGTKGKMYIRLVTNETIAPEDIEPDENMAKVQSVVVCIPIIRPMSQLSFLSQFADCHVRRYLQWSGT